CVKLLVGRHRRVPLKTCRQKLQFAEFSRSFPQRNSACLSVMAAPSGRATRTFTLAFQVTFFMSAVETKRTDNSLLAALPFFAYRLPFQQLNHISQRFFSSQQRGAP